MSIKPKEDRMMNATSIDQKMVEPVLGEKSTVAAPSGAVPQVDLGMRSAAPAPVVHGAVSPEQPAQIESTAAALNPLPGSVVAGLLAQIEKLQAQLAQTGRTEVAPPPVGAPLSRPLFVSKSKGYPVQPGQTWHDLSPQQRHDWFRQHESRWKDKFGIQNAGVQANLGWSRG